jgi:hypothetical protein
MTTPQVDVVRLVERRVRMVAGWFGKREPFGRDLHRPWNLSSAGQHAHNHRMNRRERRRRDEAGLFSGISDAGAFGGGIRSDRT